MGPLADELLLILHQLWRRRWLALAIAWAVALIGWAVVSLIPARYQVESSVLVLSREGIGGQMNTQVQSQQGMDALRRALQAASTLDQVARQTPLAKGGDDAAAARGGDILSRAVAVSIEQDSILHITTTMGERSFSAQENADIAFQATEILTRMVMSGALDGGGKDAAQSLAFLNRQIDERARQLAVAEARRAAFEDQYLAGLPGTGSTEDRLANARLDLERVQAELAAAQGSLNALGGQLATTPASISVASPGPMGETMSASASAAVEAQIAEGQARGWTDEHPDMMVLRRQLERARQIEGRRGGRAPGTMGNPAYAQLRAMHAERAASVAALSERRAQLASAIARVTALQTGNAELSGQKNRLDRDYAVLRSQYDKLLQDREEVKLRGEAAAQGGAGRYTLIAPPLHPAAPISPNRPVLYLGVLVAALGIGLGTAFLLARLRQTYAEPDRLARDSAMPVLGAVSQVRTADMRMGERLALGRFALASAALFGVGAVLTAFTFWMSRVG